MRVLPWLSKAIVLLAIALLIYFPIEVVLLLQQHQWPEPNTPVFLHYLLLSSLYILTLILSIWIIYRKQYAWLGVYLYLFIPVLFFRSGARRSITQAWEQTDFINSVWLKSYDGTTLWLSLITMLFFMWLYQQYSYRLTALTPWTKRLSLLAVGFVLPAYFVGFNFTYMVWAPLEYMFAPTITSQIAALLRTLPLLSVFLLGIWGIYNQRFYLLVIPLTVSFYYIFLIPASAINALQNAWGRYEILPLSSQVSAITIILAFVIVFLVLFSWLYEYHRMNNE